MLARTLEVDERSIQRLANAAARQAIRQAQPLLDDLHAKHRGKPIEEVEPHVRALFRRLGWKPQSPSEVTEYAESIAEGDRIVLRHA